MNIHEAIGRYSSVERAKEERGLDFASNLWRGVTDGLGAHGYADSLFETMPVEVSAELSKCGVASSVAFRIAFENDGEKLSPFKQREKAREVWAEFSKKAELARNMKEGFGADDSEAWEQVRDTENCYCDDSSIRAIAKLAGRMFSQLKNMRSTETTNAPEEVYSVEVGDNIGRLLPTELVHLGEASEILLLYRISQKTALQYAVKAPSVKNRGPLVICIDESGSMHDESGTGRNTWAKAAMVSLTRIAWGDKRPVSVVHFSNVITTTRLDPGNTKALMRAAKHFLSGGTRIYKALDMASKEVKALEKEGSNGADVVLISDGQDFCDDFQKANAVNKIASVGASIYSVAIESEWFENDVYRKASKQYTSLNGKAMRSGDVSSLSKAVNPK